MKFPFNDWLRRGITDFIYASASPIARHGILRPWLGEGIIFCYHRIQPRQSARYPFSDSWLSVNPAVFKTHLDELQTLFDVISVEEAISRLISQKREEQRPFYCITFDDGYRDNLEHALPILESLGAPATIFVTTWKNLPTPAVYRSWPELNSFTPPDASLFLTDSDVRQLSRHPLITIGAHTNSHYPLSSLSDRNAKLEITFPKEYLEQLTGLPVRHFSYPHGSSGTFGAREITYLAEAGYASAVAAIPSVLTKNSNVYALPRTLVLPHVTGKRIVVLASGMSNILGRSF